MLVRLRALLGDSSVLVKNVELAAVPRVTESVSLDVDVPVVLSVVDVVWREGGGVTVVLSPFSCHLMRCFPDLGERMMRRGWEMVDLTIKEKIDAAG